MASVSNNLYPPLITTMQDAFTGTTCKVYFSLSDYNTISDINTTAVQVTVKNQNTNVSVLSTSKYPTGIMLKTLQTDSSVTDDYKYYISFSTDDLAAGAFENNVFYKVQIRFTMSSVSTPSTSAIASWLTANTAYFSEWSTVTLIRHISTPEFVFSSLGDNSTPVDGDDVTLSNQSLIVSGKLTFADTTEQEYIKSYSFSLLLNDSTQKELDSSGTLYPAEAGNNEFTYSFKYLLEDGVTYKMIFSYTTVHNYSGTFVLYITAEITAEVVDISVSAEVDNDLGVINVLVPVGMEETVTGNIIIKRTSSESLFAIWENIHIIQNESVNARTFLFSDVTVKSGVWYKYAVQNEIDAGSGTYSALVYTDDPVMIILDDMFLINNYTMLKIAYDPTISSYQYKVSDQMTETIGAKYPFFRRNGKLGYKTFSISGTISALTDDDAFFTSREKMYGEEIAALYETYNQKNWIYDYTDRIYERDFREKVLEFLTDGKVKLFRSTPEGNILVRLMNVSLTPKNELGRMIYSFTATAYEYDEATIDNYDTYNIQSLEIPSDYYELILYTKDGVTASSSALMTSEYVIDDEDETTDEEYSLILLNRRVILSR